MKLITTIMIFIFLQIFLIRANTEEELIPKRNFKSLVFVSLGMPFNTGSSNFFQIYGNEFGGYEKDFKSLPNIGAGTKFRFESNYRLGIQFNMLSSSIRDTYMQEVRTIDDFGNRYITQTISVKDIPIIATAEYLPYVTQFRSYLGGGLGFLIRNIEWQEIVNSTITLDHRVGGINFKDTELHPFLKLYTGLELGFDKMNESTFLGSLVIEVSFNYAFAESDLYKNVRRQFVPESSRLKERVNVLPGYFLLTFALTFNFNQNNS